MLRQKHQSDKIKPVDTKMEDYKAQYVAQRARGAYIASICQPEASFDMAAAAQHKDPTVEHANSLNKRLIWQTDNAERGLRMIPLDLKTAKLYTFVDASFANNQDLSSQIGFIIVFANESPSSGTFDIKGNIIHWSSVKCKRVTKSVLASEVLAMSHGIDSAIPLSTTLNKIMKQLGLEDIPNIVCTDSFSLYECLVKLGTTKEKRLMIDIMSARQSYERRELTEVRWINGGDNPADAMTKAKPNSALQQLVEENKLSVRVQGWVNRKGDGKKE